MNKSVEPRLSPASIEENDKSPPSSSRSTHARALRSAVALREALLELLKHRPFEQITVREITNSADLHYATFFRHYETKEALLESIAVDQIDQVNRLTLAIRDSNDYASGFLGLCEYVESHRSLWSTLFNGGAGAAMREEWIRKSKKIAENEKPMNTWMPPELGAIFAATLIAEALAWWVAQPLDKYSANQVSEIIYRALRSSMLEPQ